MSKISFTKKLILVTILFILPLAYTTTVLVNSTREVIQNSENEKVGFELFSNQQKVLIGIADHRAKLRAFMKGTKSARVDAIKIEEEMKINIETSLELASRHPEMVYVIENIKSQQKQLQDILFDAIDKKAPISWINADSGENTYIEAHTQLIKNINNSFATLKIDYDLSTDADPINSLLISTLTENLPALYLIFRILAF